MLFVSFANMIYSEIGKSTLLMIDTISIWWILLFIYFFTLSTNLHVSHILFVNLFSAHKQDDWILSVLTSVMCIRLMVQIHPVRFFTHLPWSIIGLISWVSCRLVLGLLTYCVPPISSSYQDLVPLTFADFYYCHHLISLHELFPFWIDK